MLRKFFGAAALTAVAMFGSGADAATISFDFSNSATGMTSIDLAGAPGVRTGNYNNVAITSTAAPTVVGTVVNNAGATVVGSTLTFTPGAGAAPGSPSGTNDQRLFTSFFDQFGTPASTIQVTGIPFAQYDVYFYRQGTETNAAIRAGQFTIGGVSKYVRGGLPDPTSTGTGYVESTDTTFNGGTTTQGNFVRFTNLTGATLNASFNGVNAGDASVLRNKVAGFQIVEVPEPTSVGLIAAGGLLLLRRRDRRAD